MYLTNGMNHLVDSFKIGFLSDRIVDALSKYAPDSPQKIAAAEKSALSDGAFFLEKVLNGKRQMSTGAYEKNALESIMVYNKSVSIVLGIPDFSKKIDSKEIESIFKELRDNLNRITNGESVPKEEIEKITKFFHYLRKQTLDDSTAIMDGVYESRRINKWESPLERLL